MYNEEQFELKTKAELFGNKWQDCKFKHERMGVLDDGRVQVRLTCHNEWLEEDLSVVTNTDQIGVTPFGKGHIAKVIAQKENGEEVTLYGYFPEENTRAYDELEYAAGICITLASGATEECFGNYSVELAREHA